MRTAATGPRILLKRLREVMAEPLDAQARLDRITRHIAQLMVTEVCSVYALRADGMLELYASEGLNPQAVHMAVLPMGKGLVGTIAASLRPINTDDVQRHPAFAYLPETGEEIFHSFLGVPVLRSGRALGVLVVQNQARRVYQEDEIEALETIAMVLAELIAAGELEGLNRPGTRLDQSRPVQREGSGFAEGIGLGYVMLHEPRIVVTQVIADDPEAEQVRLSAALDRLRLSIDDLLERGDLAVDGEHRQVLETYRMFAADRGWVRRMEESISNGLTAEAAVEKVQSDYRARMSRFQDAYLRERLHDFDDLAWRLLRELMGKPHGPLAEHVSGDYIILARNMGAADLLDYSRDQLRGLVLEEGTPTSHVVIVARALGIPVVGQVGNILDIAENGDPVIVDGVDGLVHLRPMAEVEAAYAEKVRFRARRQAGYDALRSLPTVSTDGVAVDLLLNAGLAMDLPHMDQSGAAGIGLFRTELQFMVASQFPRRSEQERLYRAVLEAAGERPVTFRTLDIGGDKVLPYGEVLHEENPALGWRAIRLTLDRPTLMRMQAQALLRAGAGRPLRIMLPMLTELREFRQARALIEGEAERLAVRGLPGPSTLAIGAMLEVPALLFQLDDLMAEADFVSVGSNDLFQFFTATDRGNPRLADRFDPLSRAFLRVLRMVVEAGARHACKVTLCGELAGRPLTAMALLGLGYRSLSMASPSIGPVKAMLLDLDIGALETMLLTEIAKPPGDMTMREILTDWANDHGVPL